MGWAIAASDNRVMAQRDIMANEARTDVATPLSLLGLNRDRWPTCHRLALPGGKLLEPGAIWYSTAQGLAQCLSHNIHPFISLSFDEAGACSIRSL